ncbi:toll-like receptor 2 isoform X2 [Macaca fascicularis]|uniref:toll-like receptor 2 isoform X2 n=1 Tax=Macaca fascicularis TaxID=9541 RepID=UPI003D15EF13
MPHTLWMVWVLGVIISLSKEESSNQASLSCDHNGICKGSSGSLNSIPSVLTEAVKCLDLSNNRITYISNSDLQSERDAYWVENLMVQELENFNPPFKLCLHKRDFIPGKWIIDNIIDSIEKSHKTVFVLSENFVKSEWCKYELDFSHFRLFDENNDAAILVLLEPIEKKAIPQRFCKLRKIMNTKTYLEWPMDEARQEGFWVNLRAAIKS